MGKRASFEYLFRESISSKHVCCSIKKHKEMKAKRENKMSKALEKIQKGMKEKRKKKRY